MDCASATNSSIKQISINRKLLNSTDLATSKSKSEYDFNIPIHNKSFNNNPHSNFDTNDQFVSNSSLNIHYLQSQSNSTIQFDTNPSVECVNSNYLFDNKHYNLCNNQFNYHYNYSHNNEVDNTDCQFNKHDDFEHCEYNLFNNSINNSNYQEIHDNHQIPLYMYTD